MEQYYYSSATLTAYSADQMLGLFGINVETTDISILNLGGFYPVVETAPSFDNYLYTASPVYTVSGQYADQTWVYTPRPLDLAKQNGDWEAKTQAASDVSLVECDCGLTTDILTAVSSQELIDRPARFQSVLDSMTAVTDALDSNLTAIEAATSVDEINNIVNPPGGILFTGRGAGLGPQDLNVSYYTAFNSVSMAESETELYVPSTDTVIPYGSGGPGQFDSMGNCFSPEGPYVIQIRESATSRVIAEITVPLAPAGVDVAF
jgi:hypothetical protein